MNNDKRSNVLAILGGVFVAVGLLSLLVLVLGPVAHVLLWLTGILWPVVLVALGIVLLTRGRRTGQQSADVSQTGEDSTAPGVASGAKRLYRSRTDRMIGGVMGGLADYLGMDPTIVRIAYAVLTLATGIGTGIVLYIVAMFVVPEQSYSSSGSANVPPAPPVPGPTAVS